MPYSCDGLVCPPPISFALPFTPTREVVRWYVAHRKNLVLTIGLLCIISCVHVVNLSASPYIRVRHTYTIIVCAVSDHLCEKQLKVLEMFSTSNKTFLPIYFPHLSQKIIELVLFKYYLFSLSILTAITTLFLYRFFIPNNFSGFLSIPSSLWKIFLWIIILFFSQIW